MKKSLCAVALSYLLILSVVPARSQAAREATIEPETKARIVLQSHLSSKLNEPGDTITAILYEPIYVNGNLVLPRGTEFQGRVISVNPARRGMKKGSMSILFDKINMPWGQETVAISFTSIDDWNKDKKYKADSEGGVEGDRNGEKAAENARTGAVIGSAGAGTAVLVSGGARGAAIGGGIGLGVAVLTGLLLTKGGDVNVAPGAMFRIKFDKPITLPVVQTASQTPKPIQQEPQETPPTKKP
ncbi:MAG: hypothetical protein AB1631_12705 [Acidobacteriota bacterium]